MAWTYSQSTGKLTDSDGKVVGIGYSGRYPDGKNQAAMQNVPDVGPIPCGTYSVEAPVNTVTHGPFVLRLDPSPSNDMYGRSGFLMHGDSVVSPGTASGGCIIMSRDVREAVWDSGDRILTVISGAEENT